MRVLLSIFCLTVLVSCTQEPSPIDWFIPAFGSSRLLILDEHTAPNGSAVPGLVHDQTSNGSARRRYLRGKAFLDAKRFDKALPLIRTAAAKSLPQAETDLAWMYSEGYGLPANPVEATRWYKSAAAHGEPAAQTVLGWMYYNGTNLRQDYAEALRWFRLAADQGYGEAQFFLGVAYYDEKSRNLSDAEIEKLVRQSGAFVIPIGPPELHNLNTWFRAGHHDVPAYFKAAYKWFRRAAAKGSPGAQCGLGLFYFYGIGVPSKRRIGFDWQRSKDMPPVNITWDCSTISVKVFQRIMPKRPNGTARQRNSVCLTQKTTLGSSTDGEPESCGTQRKV